MWVSARAFGEIAERMNQPAVLGELVAGVVVGTGFLGWIDPHDEVLHLLAEMGVLILLFEIGLEMRLPDLLRVGGAATLVALTGVVLPVAAGYALATAWGATPVAAVFLGATLAATSVGVTARVLRDLGRLASTEARVILGAAVIDDVLGLVLLTLVTRVLAGEPLSALVALRIVTIAVAFLVAALLIGRRLAPPALRLAARLHGRGGLIAAAAVTVCAFAFVAGQAGSAAILGAFAAGLVFAETDRRADIERDVRPIAYLFVPIFFVVVGAQVDLRAFNPLAPGGWRLLGGVLAVLAVAIATKWAAGLAPFWLHGIRRNVVGVGMVPRGEVGLIFAQVGRSTGLLDARQFSALVLIVMGTTFVAPLLLRRLLPPDRDALARPDDTPRTGPVERLVAGTS
ncbi:MAG: cation:proton antiporter [Gemmatimonadetes bacterium]|nr:cation:proton antiporter [Gemmatimonadota bacterium]